jgi:hypothetical protein
MNAGSSADCTRLCCGDEYPDSSAEYTDCCSSDGGDTWRYAGSSDDRMV